MLQRWCLVWYLSRYKNSNTDWWNNTHVEAFTFVVYLATEKYFLEDWRETLKRWLFKLIRKKYEPSRERIEEHWARIKDVLLSCQKDNLVKTSSGKPLNNLIDDNIFADHESREFLRPLTFINAVFKKYGYFESFFIGLAIPTALWLLHYIWSII